MCRKINFFYFLILVSDYSEEGFFENKTKLKPKFVIESNIFFNSKFFLQKFQLLTSVFFGFA